MALCITASILAATIVTLLAGFWMWVSLMVLPAAVAVLLLVLRFVDDRRVRRSLQLAVILSLAVHCIFLIVAHQTEVFHGLFVEVNRQVTPVRQQRVIQVSRLAETRPWMEINPTPTPSPAEPEPEKQADRDAATIRPQPAPLENQTPSENPQLVQRQQVSRTVPRLGKNLSELSRQSRDLQPKSSQPVEMARPAPATPAAVLDRPVAEDSEISRPSATSASSAEPQRQRRERLSESRAAGQISRSPSRELPAASTPLKSSGETVIADETRPRIARTPSVPPTTAPSRPESVAAASRPQASPATVQRQATASNANRAPNRDNRPQTRITETQARPVPRDNVTQPAIDRRVVENRPARSSTSAVQPTSPVRAERPAAVRPATANLATGRLEPQPLAIEKSSSGTAGVGRAVNMDRDLGSIQSPALQPANSLNRRQRTTLTPDSSSLTLQQAAEIPVASAAERVPGSTLRPDTIPLASRAAAPNRAEMTASSSAALNQSNSTAETGKTSVEKGTGSADLGSTRIVTEIPGRRVEGGGQPEIANQPSDVPSVRNGDAGAREPAIAAAITQPVVSDNMASPGQSRLADTPSIAAESDLTARSGPASTESGEPERRPAGAAEARMSDDLAQTNIDRAGPADDEDEQERERQLRGMIDPSSGSAPVIGNNATPDADVAAAMNLPLAPGSADESRKVEIVAASGVARDEDLKSEAGGSAARRAQRPTSPGADEMVAGQPRGAGPGGRQQSRTGPGAGQGPGPVDQPAGPVGNDQRLPETNLAPRPASLVAGSTGRSRQINEAANVAQLARDAPAGMSLNIEVRPGPAGVGNLPEPDVGVDSRRASRESPAIQSMSETRFRKTETGGAPSVSAAPTIAREAFRSRNQPSRAAAAPDTEESIELGLAFLARYQQDDGSWTLGGFDMDRSDRANMISSDTAATGLALLAFQGAGYHHKEFKYAIRLQNAISWLVENQSPEGELYRAGDENSNRFARLYSHAIATIALAEAYGMTQDSALRQPVQRALDYITGIQDPNQGGWRYTPGINSDTSVTGWMVMALQSGRLAGLETDPETFDHVRRWLDVAQDARQDHLYRYNPEAEDTAEWRRSQGRIPTPCMTAVGLLMRLYIDWDKVDPRFDDGTRYLLDHLPDDSSIETRDTYYWYYATQILKHLGGQAWETWYQSLHPLLVSTQIRQGDLSGSWNPLEPVPDRWGAHGGRIYVTTMNLLSLEVEYRLLPLYDESPKPATRD